MDNNFKALSVGAKRDFLLDNCAVILTCTGVSEQTASFIDEDGMEFLVDSNCLLYLKDGSDRSPVGYLF